MKTSRPWKKSPLGVSGEVDTSGNFRTEREEGDGLRLSGREVDRAVLGGSLPE